MFKIGDTIKYGTEGICEVTDITTREFAMKPTEYYVLAPLTRRDFTIFVPTDSEVLTSKMQHILSKNEIYALLNDISGCNVEWIENDKKRAEVFGKMLRSSDRRDIIALIRTIYEKRAELTQNFKKLHAADEHIIKEAERIIADEFSAVLGILPTEVPQFIADIVEKR